MKVWKKWMSGLLAGLLFMAAVTGCSQTETQSSQDAQESSSVSQNEGESSEVSQNETSESTEKVSINIAALKGPTGLGMLKLMSDSDAGETQNDYHFELLSDSNDMVGKITTGEADIAAVPTNMAALLYQKTQGKVQLAALNTLGVLYILTNGETVESIQDLKGKTVYATGQGAVPEYALDYILQQNGLEVGTDVTVEYKAEHAELASLLIAGDASIAMLPEPYVTQVLSKNPDISVALNLTEEWEKAAGAESVLTMGCIVVRKEFAEEHKDALDAFLSEYEASISYTNSDPENASTLSEQYDIMPAAVAAKAIPNCNIVYMDGSEMKEKVSAFFDVLFQANPQSIGGALPDDAFYYQK